MEGIVILAEIAEALAAHGQLRCRPEIEQIDGRLILRLAIPVPGMWDMPTRTHGDPPNMAALEVLSLADELQHVIDLANLRALATKFDIEPAALEALLPASGGD